MYPFLTCASFKNANKENCIYKISSDDNILSSEMKKA